MSKLYLPDMVRWGNQSDPDTLMIGVHGFAGGATDYKLLGSSLAEKNPDIQTVSWDRAREPELRPPSISGTGAIQANSAELLMVLGELAQQDSVNSLNLAGHSLGGPIVAAAIQMVLDGNLPAGLASEQKRLEEIIKGIGAINLIAPAGFTNAYALTPLAGFAGHSLARAIFNGAKGIIKDSEGAGDLWEQRIRVIAAARYLAKFKFSIEECVDACGPDTMMTFANNPELSKKLAIITYAGDEILPSERIESTLQNPDIRATDFAVYEALKSLNPKKALTPMSHLSLPGTAGFMAMRAAGIFKSEDNHDPFNPTQEQSLAALAKKIVALPGNHTTPLTKAGAEELAPHIGLGSFASAA